MSAPPSSTLVAASHAEAEAARAAAWPLPFRAARRLQRRLRRGYDVALTGAALIPAVPAGLLGLSFPDFDISTLGIGAHRYFFFHSAIAPALLRRAYGRYTAAYARRETPTPGGRILGAALGAFSAGVGVHLLVDGLFQPGKAVLFPVLGSLVAGTRVDDRLWLIGNGLYCFHLARDLLVFAVGDRVEELRREVHDRFEAVVRRGIAEASS